MTKQTETVSFRETALAFSNQKVTAMKLAIEASFDARDLFEAANGNSITDRNSYTKARDGMLKSSVAVSRFFLALGIKPSDVIERKVQSNAMFNAKALDKVTELARYAVDVASVSRLQRVTKAFIACCLVSADKGIEVVTNAINARFLNSDDLSHYIADADLLDHIAENRHAAMSSGAATQSSQARNVLDVLGLGAIRTVERARDAIAIDAKHSFYDQFRADFMKA